MTESSSALHDAVVDELAEARARWPRLRIDDESFLPYLAARLPHEDDHGAAAAVARVHVADLFLAFGCVLGDPAAIGRFQAAYGATIRAQVARIDSESADDIAQRILARLLVGDGGDLPRLATYAGRSPLAMWLKVVATREALMHRRKGRDPASAPETPLADLVADDDDPELTLMRTRYRDDFRRAFEDALAELDATDRSLLRYHLVDRLTIDDLARIHSVHRATAARWLAKTRERLLRDTRRNLMSRLQLSRAELESVFRLVRSQLEVSVRRLLDA